jgi:hypothetical protein
MLIKSKNFLNNTTLFSFTIANTHFFYTSNERTPLKPKILYKKPYLGYAWTTKTLNFFKLNPII